MAETTAAAAPGTQTQTGTEQQNGNGQPENTGAAAAPEKPVITDELGLEWLKERGIHAPDLNTLKEKANFTPPPPPPTKEELTKAEKEKEAKLVNLYMSKGGTPETYAYLKTLLAADPKEIGNQKEVEALMKEGLSRDKAEELVAKMHLQISDEDVDALEDEKEKEVLKKGKLYGSKKQENRGKYLQTQAKSFFDNLESELQELESEKELIASHSVKVTEAIKNYPKKESLELGQIENVAIAPLDFEVSDEALTEAENILKDAKQFDNQLYNKDGSVNIDFLLPHLVRSLSFKDLAKRGFLVGRDSQVQHYKNVFGPNQIPDLGSPKKTDGKGQVVSAGKPQVMDGRPATK